MNFVGQRFGMLSRFQERAPLGRPNLLFSGGENPEKAYETEVASGDTVELQGRTPHGDESPIIRRYKEIQDEIKAILAELQKESLAEALGDTEVGNTSLSARAEEVQQLRARASKEERARMRDLWLESTFGSAVVPGED